MNDSVKNFIVTQFVNSYLPKEYIAINAWANDISTWDMYGNYEVHGCFAPIAFSQPLKLLLANYNLPDSVLRNQTNNYVRLWDKKKVPFKLVKFDKLQTLPWRSLMPLPGWLYPKYIYSISNPIQVDSNKVAIKYHITKRNGQFVTGPVLAIFQNDNGNLTLLSELK